MRPGAELLFARLFDDAAIFPPGNAPMLAALDAHCAALASPIAPFIGSFVCSAARLPELQRALGERTIELALTTDAEHYPDVVHTALADRRFTLRAVEIASHDVVRPVAELPAETTLYVELPWGAQPDLPPGAALKFRTGGDNSEAFPSEARLAHAIGYCVEQGIAFKLTAGLHDAIRHRDPVSGFEHHGFLNVVLAVLAALGGATEAEVAGVLGREDAAGVIAAITSMTGADIDRVRHFFRSFGTCSIGDPIRDLQKLTLLEVQP